ncbi:hypothetical protein [Oceanobacillus halotolerans]|uniref:hypothetical protein n=1 Tax=Oceanobacillus halotolerans TaxID=2663380 RepID=UPI0013D98D0C|nr:hypothetical protein [Oceanobacillus halotolerans]
MEKIIQEQDYSGLYLIILLLGILTLRKINTLETKKKDLQAKRLGVSTKYNLIGKVYLG